jgi:hypothetical protein
MVGRAIVENAGALVSPITSKPASQGRIKTSHSECFVHIRFLDTGKGLFNFFIAAGFRSLDSLLGETVCQATPMVSICKQRAGRTLVAGKLRHHGFSKLMVAILVPGGRFLTCR